MSLSKGNRNIAYPLIAVLSIIALIFMYTKYDGLQKETERIIAQRDSLQNQADFLQTLLAVDTLLLDNQFDKAYSLIDQLGVGIEDPGLVNFLGAREEAITRSQENWINAQPRPVLPKFASVQETPRSAVPVANNEMNSDSLMNLQNRLDSMAFALQKAEMFADKLQVQVKGNTAGNYLSFKSRKGNMVYYVGDIKEGKAHGSGVGLFSTGSRYEGDWLNNLKHGKGVFQWQDGATYDGEYKDDLRHGTGTYHWPDGQKFVGEWEKDVRSGEGTFYDDKGKMVATGLWRDDELVKADKEK